MATGTVKWFKCEGGAKVQFDPACRGTRVSFGRVADRTEPRTANVSAVPLLAARRARSRGGG
jgi:cold shock CspA family protein